MKTDTIFIKHSESFWYDIPKGELFMRLKFLGADPDNSEMRYYGTHEKESSKYL